MPGANAIARKAAYFEKLVGLFEKYPSCLIVSADCVGAAHMQAIRRELRAFDSVLLMGKNTMIRKALRQHAEQMPALDNLVSHIRGNIGFVFCRQDQMVELKDMIKTNRVPAAAKAGVLAPVDVFVHAGPTGLEPTQTSFLQAMNIPTKINRGQIEITKDQQVVTAGEKVSSSAAALLSKLGVRPFTFGLEMRTVYDNGAIYDAAVLDMTDDLILGKFCEGVSAIAALSLETHFPTKAAVPHLFADGYKHVLAIALATNYVYEQAKKIKEISENPELAAQLAAANAAPAAADAAAADDKPAAKEESSSESDEEMGFDLFD